MTSIKGVIFDFDGLIIDSEGADQIAWREQFALAGVAITAEQHAAWWHHWSWHRETRMIEHLQELAGAPVDAEAIHAAKLARYTELCAVLPARPGIREWIEQAATLGLRCGVATNDDTGRTPSHLARLGLHFDAVVTLQPGLARKPAPDLYQQALTILGLDPGEAVAVEDSSHGVEAAHRAGMHAIAYPTPTVSAHTDLTGADLIADPSQITLSQALGALHISTGAR